MLAPLLQYGAFNYTCPAAFPTSVFTSYYPTPAGQQVQPIITDEVYPQGYPLNLTSPLTVQTLNLVDPVIYPNVTAAAAGGNATYDSVYAQIVGIINGTDSNCTKCTNALNLAQQLARTSPSDVPKLAVNLCTAYNFGSNATCQTYRAQGLGATIAQVLTYAQVLDLDGRYICYQFLKGACKEPAALKLNLTNYFSPRPSTPKKFKASGKRVKVLHLSDFHLDPRYQNGAEANCTSGLCCRAGTSGNITQPASRFGAFKCDVPYDLALSALQAIPKIASPNGTADFALTLYTGDLVSHDTPNQLSRGYVEYVETVVYRLFKKYLGGPVYAALGNHDTTPVAMDAPYSLPNNLANQSFAWNYDHVTSLWTEEGWFNTTSAHYGAYSTKVPGHNLRIITINTDFWYKSNYYNYINMSQVDISGTFRFLTDELQGAENRGERVWIVGHVLSGWDGSNPLKDQTNLFYAIVDRFAPTTIANIFFGHTHEDQFTVFYKNNGTLQNAKTAIANAWIGPSITPLTNLNSGFRIYEVDTGNYLVYDARTFYSNVSTYAAVESRNTTGISYQFEYSSRDAYDPQHKYPLNQPLDASFWHQATDNMLQNYTLMNQFTQYQGKLSSQTGNCTSQACVTAKVCYMRSGSSVLGKACPPGFASVQGGSSS